jgi:hypothetical protein
VIVEVLGAGKMQNIHMVSNPESLLDG